MYVNDDKICYKIFISLKSYEKTALKIQCYYKYSIHFRKKYFIINI